MVDVDFYWDLPPASMILYDDICIRMDGWIDSNWEFMVSL